MRRRGPLLLLALVVGGLLLGTRVRGALGLELSTEAIRSLVAPLGWKGPALLTGLVTFRQFVLIPSALLLAAGGLAFGATVGTATAHPAGPMSAFHWGAGFSSMGAAAFATAVLLASPVRAGALSLFGANVLAPGSPGFWGASALLAVVAALPLLHPGLRRRIFGGWTRGAAGDPGARPGPPADD